MSYSKGETITLYISSMITGSISLLSSGTISIMILISEEKLSYPFRRFIFGLCVADVIQSISLILGPFSLPKDNDGVLWSNGNTFTCSLQGFALHLGFAGVPMYVLSLSAYYLCAVKYSMNDKKFARKVEPFFHTISILWTVVGGVACWHSSVFNMMRSGNMCWYTPYPHDCVAKDDVDCIRGKRAFVYGWLFGGSNFLTLGGIIYCLYGVCRTVIVAERKTASHLWQSGIEANVIEEKAYSQRCFAICSWLREAFQNARKRGSGHHDGDVVEMEANHKGPRVSFQQEFKSRSRKRRREAMMQASLYVISFLASCIWAYLYGFIVTLGYGVPFTLSLFFSVFYPLGGFFNILVYTRPKVNTFRRRQKDLSWPRAFIEVIRAGVEVPDVSRLQSVQFQYESSAASVTCEQENTRKLRIEELVSKIALEEELDSDSDDKGVRSVDHSANNNPDLKLIDEIDESGSDSSSVENVQCEEKSLSVDSK